MTWLDHLRDYLIDEGLVRAPDDAAAQPLPPVWRHPNGAIAPGDRADAGAPAAQHDDGLVVSLMRAPDLAVAAEDVDRVIRGVDVVFRGTRVQEIDDLEREIRRRLLGEPPDPGGRTDWVMAGLYVIQSRPWRPFQPLDTEPRGDAGDVFTFSTGWVFELRG